MFRRFFRLAKNGDWYTMEKTRVERPNLLASDSIVPFKMVWRKSDVVLNEKEPQGPDLDPILYTKLRSFSSRVHPFPKEVLVMLGLSVQWNSIEFDPMFSVNGKEMSALDFKSSLMTFAEMSALDFI